MFTRDDFFRMLHDSPMYKAARSGFKTEAEKKQLDAFMVAQFGELIDVLSKASEAAESDPRFHEKLQLALENRDSVVIDETVATVSGSHG